MRFFLKLLGIVLISAAALLVVFLYSNFLQRKTVIWTLQRQGVKNVTLGGIDVRINGIAVEHLSLTHDQWHLSVAKLDVQVAPIRYLLGKGLRLKNVEGDGIVWTALTPTSSTTKTAITKASLKPYYCAGVGYNLPQFEGVLTALGHMPVEIERLQLGLTLQFPDIAPIDLQFTGNHLLRDGDGKLHLIGKCTNVMRRQRMLPASLEADFTTKTTAGLFTHAIVDLHADVGGNPLVANATVAQTETGETYRVTTNVQKSKTLLTLNGNYEKKSQNLTAQLEFDVDDGKVTPFFQLIRPFLGATVELPGFDLKGQGTVEGNPIKGPLQANFSGTAHLDNLGKCYPALKALNTVDGQLNASVTLTPKWIEIVKFDGKLFDGQKRCLLQCELNEALKITQNGIDSSREEVPCHLRFSCPLPYLQPLLTAHVPHYTTPAGTANGDVSIRLLKSGAIAWHTNEPLTLDNLKINFDADTLCEGLHVQLDTEGSYHNGGANFDNIVTVNDSVGRAIFHNTVSGALEINRDQLKSFALEGHPELNLEALGKQPMFAKYNFPATYQLSGIFSIFFDNKKGLNVKQFDCDLKAGEQSIGNVAIVKPFTLDWPLNWSNLSGELLTIDLKNLPLALFNPFLSPYKIQSGNLTTQCLIKSHKPQGLIVEAQRSAEVQNLALDGPQGPALRAVSLSTHPYGAYNVDTHAGTLNLKNLKLSASEGTLAEGNVACATVGSFPFIQTSDIRIVADLDHWQAQPTFASLRQLSGDLNLQLQMNKDGYVDANFAWVSKLKTPVDRTFTLRAQANGILGRKTTLKVPLEFTGLNGKSDCLLDLSIANGKTTNVVCLCTGNNLVLDDILQLAGSFSADKTAPSQNSENAPSGLSARAPVIPFWGNVRGKIGAKFDTIIYEGAKVADNLEAAIAIDDDKLNQTLKGNVCDGKIEQRCEITHTKRLYKTNFDANVEQLNAKKLLHVTLPQKSEIFSGNINLETKCSAEHEGTVASLLEHLKGNVKLSSKDGVIAPLADDGKGAKEALVDIGGALLGSFVKPLATATVATSYFKRIPYDKLEIIVKRENDRHIIFEKLFLKNPELYLTGGGKIRYEEGVALGNQALAIDLQVDGLGKCAEMLSSLRRLEETQSKAGYYRGPRLQLRGTCNKLDYKQIVQTFLVPGSEPDWMHPQQENAPAEAAKALTDELKKLFK